MVTESAFVVVHSMTAVVPCRIFVLALPSHGCAAAAHTDTVIVGSGNTDTEACCCTVPPVPVAVAVNVVETSTDTFIEPLTATLPIPLSMVTDCAFVAFHVRVTVPPWTTL